MKRFCVCVVTVALLGSAIPAAFGQRPQGAGSGRYGGIGLFGLLAQKSVQDELKLSAEQLASVNKAVEKQREQAAANRDLSREERRKLWQERAAAHEKEAGGILNADQLKRLKEIHLQQRGAAALTDPAVAEALKLTDEQKGKIQAIRDEVTKETRALFGGGNRQEARAKARELRKTSGEKILALLTEEQATQWKGMLGAPFTGEIRPAFGPGRGGRGRNAGPPPDQA